jgi:methionyl-tRNA formyltransferase
MQIEHGLDTGGVFARAVVPIGDRATAVELRAELVAVGTRLLVDALTAGLGEPQPQRGEPVYAARIDAAELRIDWSRSAAELDRLVRLGGAWSMFRSKRMKIVVAEPLDGGQAERPMEPGSLADGVVACGSGALALRVVQPEGKPAMPFAAWANGARPRSGERFEP